jgi:hypothetical protein
MRLAATVSIESWGQERESPAGNLPTGPSSEHTPLYLRRISLLIELNGAPPVAGCTVIR